jgi:gamma-glutamyltranspeptidase
MLTTGLSKMFMSNGKFKVQGNTIARPEYANMLERLANEVCYLNFTFITFN